MELLRQFGSRSPPIIDDPPLPPAMLPSIASDGLVTWPVARAIQLTHNSLSLDVPQPRVM